MLSGAYALRKKLIGDKAFYKALLMIIVPVIIQNVISNFVSLLDNLMVGTLGTNEISGVAVANQLVFIFNLCVFGGLSGPGIFTAQYFGAGDMQGIRHTFRYKLLLALIISATAILIIVVMGPSIIGLFLKGEANGANVDPQMILGNANTYITIMLIGMPISGIAAVYASTLRETGDAFWPMLASVSAVVTNLVGNWILIFGKLGFPQMGVAGAATATVFSRFVQFSIVALRAHTKKHEYPYIQGVYQTLQIPKNIAWKITKTGAPLLFNEAIWSMGISTLTIIYSWCGLKVVGALSIQSTIANMFNAFALSTGTGISVIVGQSLGAGDFEKAKDQVWKIFAFSEFLAITIGAILFCLAGVIPLAYTEIEKDVKDLASALLRITAFGLPISVMANCSYFTIRSGGKTIITFLFDCVFTWSVSVLLAFILVRFAGLDIIPTFICVTLADISKGVLGFILIKKGVWIKNITE